MGKSTDNERDCLRGAYAIPHAARFVRIAHCENSTFAVVAGDRGWVIRRRRARHEPTALDRGELRWMEALGQLLAVPRPIRTSKGEEFAILEDDGGLITFTAFELLYGHHLHLLTPDDWIEYGRFMRALHVTADRIDRDDITTAARPTYDQNTLIDKPTEALAASDWIPAALADRIRAFSETVDRLYAEADFDTREFVHFDLHTGNILISDGTWYYLDFEECGYGDRSLDLGVVRYHGRSNRTDAFDDAWPLFLRGYGIEVDQRKVRLATALRIFYTCGKIPFRLDIPQIGKDPIGLIERYLACAEAELTGL
jgi:Ser/Thr protein kinase RdoA (MazF antagonist)